MCLGLKKAVNSASMLQYILNNDTQPVDFTQYTVRWSTTLTGALDGCTPTLGYQCSLSPA